MKVKNDHRSTFLNFIYTSHHFTPHGRYELNKLTSLPMCGFIAQSVEHRTGIAEVTGSNAVEALIFSGFFFPTTIMQLQFEYELFHICFTPDIKPLQVFICKSAMPFINLILKIPIIFVFLFEVKSLHQQISV